jgi:hypothetical protein
MGLPSRIIDSLRYDSTLWTGILIVIIQARSVSFLIGSAAESLDSS